MDAFDVRAELSKSLRRGMRARLVAIAVVVISLTGCTDSRDDKPNAQSTTSSTDVPAKYANPVDGLASVSWPEGWHRAEKPLGAGRISNSVELLALTTFPGALASQCAPVPDAALAKMKSDDVLFTLRTSEGPPGAAVQRRPQRLMDAAVADADAGRGVGCYPVGVEAWKLQFQEHGRLYDVFVAARAPISASRRAEVEEIWESLRLSPISTGQDQATPGVPYWHVLFTHCGVRNTTFDGRQWVAEAEGVGRSAGPGPGRDAARPRPWTDPQEHGTIVLSKGRSWADFTSRDGERIARFRPRTPQDPPESPCQ